MIIYLIELVFNFLSLAVLARVLISWLRLDPYHPISIFVYQITEPFLSPLRKIIPPVGPLDITPIIALIIFQILERVLLSIVV
ncbi:MAG: YggT family protein [Anaerolineae bacterium]